MPRASLTPAIDVLRGVAGLMLEGFFALDRDGRVVVASERVRAALGDAAMSEGAIFASAGTDFRLLRLLDAARASGAVEEREITVDGRDLLVRAVALEADDAALLVLVRDETRVRHLERVRRDFVSNVSHELRTPVTAVQLMAETLKAGGLQDPAAAADFVDRIALEATHMAQIVEELLELSSIEYGLRPLARERVDVTELLTAVDRLRPLSEAKHVEVTCRVERATPAIDGDAGRLAQVVRNLVHNAIKFTPDGGRIDVEARPGEPGRVVIRCSDTGVGIAPADVPRVFERFWKADNSRQRDGEGSGLGLAIVRHVVEAHGGSVSVTSQPGRGTTFVVDLPAAAEV